MRGDGFRTSTGQVTFLRVNFALQNRVYDQCMNSFSDVAQLSSPELIASLKEVSHKEKVISLKVIWHLALVDERKLHLELGYPSLFAYCTEELKYDDGSAYRRVKAAKLWKRHPEIENDLESGKLSLSTAAILQSHFDRAKKRVPIERQKELIETARGKSKRQVEAELLGEKEVARAPRIRAIGKNLNRLELIVDDAFLKDLEKLRNLSAHAEQDQVTLIHDAIREKITRLQKRRFGAKITLPEKPEEKKTGRQPIPAAVRKQVHERDQGECQYTHLETQKRCGTTYALGLDHVISVEVGGKNTVENLRLLCGAHHRLRHRN